MKKLSIFVALIVSVLLLSSNSLVVYADNIEFFSGKRSFEYNLEDNKLTSDQFDLNEEINRYKRFGSLEDRRNLLNRMLDIGIAEDVAIEYLYPKMSHLVASIEKNLYVKPVNASMSIDSNSERVFVINSERCGQEVDRETLYSRIINVLLQEKDMRIKIPLKRLEPSMSAKCFARFTHLRSDYSTDISSSSADRKHNVKNALKSINRVEIAPNEVFSFNKVVGRRTEDNGYRSAKIIINNEFVDGVGGGVCQVSSTLYNAALLAGLEILEANKHSRQVSYVKYGFDAMVNFGSSDLKFRNNTNEKITIITNCSNNAARIRIYGEDLCDTKYILSNEIVKVDEPIEEIGLDTNREYIDKIRYEDEYFYLKPAIKGMQIRSYREKYVSGKLMSKELLRFDKFKSQNAIKVYGIDKREQEVSDIQDVFSATKKASSTLA